MFKFNFGSSEEQDDEGPDAEETKSLSKKDREDISSCTVIEYKEIHKEYACGESETFTLSSGMIIHYVDLEIAEWRVRQEPDIAAAVKSNSDLIPHVYEGGLKLWECALDLTEYISSLDIAFRGSKVLELGCGVGVPGLFAYNKGAEVHFQDYNESVLHAVTIPSIALNIINNTDDTEDTEDDLKELPRCKFYAGDWAAFTQLLIKDTAKQKDYCRFDMILTSETIYSAENYQCLHDTIKALLKPQGTTYLAAKSCYFGVGGNMRDLENLLKKNNVFKFRICKEICDGVNREIMEIKFK